MQAVFVMVIVTFQRHSCLIQVRHAQGFHNVEGEKDYNAYLSYDLLDAQLTHLGWQQVRHLSMCIRIAELVV